MAAHVSNAHAQLVAQVVKVRGRSGTTSIEVTIPRTFAQKLELKSGDYVSIELYQDGRLQLRKVRT